MPNLDLLRPAALEIPRWIEVLNPEDLNFIRKFVLASGSLKEMAAQYEVSYPTIRSRLDALIHKINSASHNVPETALRKLVRELVGSGQVDVATARRLIDAGEKDRRTAQGQ